MVDLFGLHIGDPATREAAKAGRQMRRRLLLGSLPLFAVPQAGFAQDGFPSRPIQMIVPYAAGSLR